MRSQYVFDQTSFLSLLVESTYGFNLTSRFVDHALCILVASFFCFDTLKTQLHSSSRGCNLMKDLLLEALRLSLSHPVIPKRHASTSPCISLQSRGSSTSIIFKNNSFLWTFSSVPKAMAFIFLTFIDAAA